MSKVLVWGNYFCDVIFNGLPRFPSLGTEIYTEGLQIVPGGVMNTVVALQRLQVETGWLGAVGTDIFSRYVLEWAENEHVDTSLLVRLNEPLQRVTVALSYPDDRSFVTYVDAPPDLIPRLAEIAHSGDYTHIHFTGLLVDSRLPPILRAMRDGGLHVSMDCQHREETLQSPGVQDTLKTIDLFMPNAPEAMRLTHTNTLDDAVARLKQIVPQLVIKNGKDGALAIDGDETCSVPALPVTPIDTTGAGDVFNAGFLAGLLRGKSLERCLQWGNICGAAATQGFGGADPAPHLQTVLDQLETYDRTT